MKMLKVPKPDMQVAFFHRLNEMRGLFLLDALLKTVQSVDIPLVDAHLAAFASGNGLKRLAS